MLGLSAANDNAPIGASIRFRVEPRLVPMEKAARRLHLSPATFSGKRQALEAAGFPLPVPVIGHYDIMAIDRWLDGLSGHQPAPMASDDFDERLARLG